MADVAEHVNKKGCFCLNEMKQHSHANLFVGDRRLVVRSDVDGQLLLHVPFTNTLRLSGLQLDAPDGEAPTRVKIWVNAPTLGFEEVDDVEPAQTLQLAAGDVGEGARLLPLKPVRFNKVDSLHVLLEREGADKVAVSSIKFVGGTVEGRTKSLTELGKKEEEA
jgi:hypothetical protein